MKDFKTIAVFTYSHEIVVIKHLLEQEDIPFYFENETIASIVPLYANALGGIQLKVHFNDIERAKTILKELEQNFTLRIV